MVTLKKLSTIVLFFLTPLSLAQSENTNTPQFNIDTRVISYYQTSLDPNYESMECVLALNCKKGWSPKTEDSGQLEGLYLRLAKPLSLSFKNSLILIIEGTYKKNRDASADDLSLFVDGKDYYTDQHIHPNGMVSYEFDTAEGDISTASSFFVRWTHPTNRGTIKAIYFLRPLTPDEEKTISKAEIVTPQFRPTHRGGENLKYQKIPFVLPQSLSIKSIAASSQLEPVEAYQPANLFDSVDSFAFSFSGKKNAGTEESLDLTFKKPVDISGFKIWNGYQRSQSHYAKNGRVKDFTLISTGKATQDVRLADTYGAQDIKLTTPLTQVSNLKLKIKSIYPGTKYKDLLLSELMFIDARGELIKPTIDKIQPSAKGLENFIDRTWSTSFSGESLQDTSDPFALTNNQNVTRFMAQMRFRSNGSFVIYTQKMLSRIKKAGQVENRRAQSIDMVLEGNWTQEKTGLRIFGRKYFIERNKKEDVKNVPDEDSPRSYTVLADQNNKNENEGIFESHVKLRYANDISEQQLSNILALLKTQHGYSRDVREFKKTNPLIFESGIFTAALTNNKTP